VVLEVPPLKNGEIFRRRHPPTSPMPRSEPDLDAYKLLQKDRVRD